jgi:hypothetical protein
MFAWLMCIDGNIEWEEWVKWWWLQEERTDVTSFRTASEVILGIPVT